ncbi:MAG: hypothetical protein JST54_22185 [Deltaproteobacteria bacterium]|nr:hypothetical protein [Deltaproteobacteria bacterium]
MTMAEREVLRELVHDALPFRSALCLGDRDGRGAAIVRAESPSAVLLAADDELGRKPLPFATGAVDLVLVRNLLERTRELFWLMHELIRVLPVGGSLVLSVANLASASNRARLLLGRQPTSLRVRSAQLRGFTWPELAQFVDGAFPGGLRLARTIGTGLDPLPELLASRLAKRLPTLAETLHLRLVKQREYHREILQMAEALDLQDEFFLGR